MRRPLRNLVAFMALSTGLSACSLLVDFDEKGQPCDELNQCLEGYTCVDNACAPDDGAPSDGGSDAGTDGGLSTDGGLDTDSGTPDLDAGFEELDAGLPDDAGTTGPGPVLEPEFPAS